MKSVDVRSILRTVEDGYSRLDNDRKFKASALVLQLQELMTTKEDSTQVQSHRGDFIASKPSELEVRRQPKNRLKPHHELQARATASKRIDVNLQNLGAKQTVVANDEFEVEVNGKRRANECKFCTSNHTVTNCPQRNRLKEGHTEEYLLSTENRYSRNETLLRNRIRHTMAHSASGAAKQCIHFLGQTSLKSNAIIHEACIHGDNKFYKVAS